MGVPGLLLAPVTGIAAAIVRKDLLLLRNDNHLPAEQLLPNQAEGSAAFVADHPVFRQGQYDFLTGSASIIWSSVRFFFRVCALTVRSASVGSGAL